MGSDSGLLCKYPGEMEETHIGFSCQFFQGKIALEMFVDVGDGVSHGRSAYSVFPAFFGGIQKVILNLCDIS